MPARVPPFRCTAQDLHLGRRADCPEHGFRIGLGVVKIDRAGRAVDVLAGGLADQHAGDQVVLFAWLAAVETGTDFEQGHIHEAARLIAGRSPQEAGQQVGAHMRQFAGNRVFQHRCVIAAAEQAGRVFIDKAVGDTFVIPQRRHRPAGRLLALLAGGQDRLWYACIHARHRFALEFGQGRDARDFLDQISLAQHVGAP